MTKPHRYFLLASISLFAIAFWFEQSSKTSSYLCKYAADIEHYLHREEGGVERIIKDRDLILAQAGYYPGGGDFRPDSMRLAAMYDQLYTICIYHNDSLVFWSNKNVQPFQTEVNQQPEGFGRRFMHLPNGYYEVIGQVMKAPEFGKVSVFGMIPVKRDYALEGFYLDNRFVADPNIPKTVSVSDESGMQAVHSRDGKLLFYLNSSGQIADREHQMLLALLVFLGFFALVGFVNKGVSLFLEGERPWRGAAFLIMAAFSMRYGAYLLDFRHLFSSLPLFANTFGDSFFHNSLGELLINILILLWITLYLHKQFRMPYYGHHSEAVRFGAGILFYFSIIVALILLTLVFKNLVLESGQTFDFDNIFNLNVYSLLSIMGVVLMLLTLFLFSHRMMLSILKTGMSQNRRVIACIVAGAFAMPVMYYSGLWLYVYYLILIAFVYITIFDYFVTAKPTLIWLVLWLVIFSAISSVILYRFNKDYDLMERLKCARMLAIENDTIAETGLSSFRNKLENDKFLRQYLTSPLPFNLYKEKFFRETINKYFSDDYYLFNHYSYSFYGFNRFNEAVLNEEVADLETYRKKMQASGATQDSALLLWSDHRGKFSYLTQAIVPGGRVAENSLILDFEFHRDEKKYSKVYTELLLNKQYKNLTDLEKYSYAVYKGGQMVASGEKEKIYEQTLRLQTLPPVGKSVVYNLGNRTELLYHGPDDTVVMIGKENGGPIKPFSLFSYIFTLTVIMVILLSVINTFLPFLPELLSFSIPRRPPLRSRIQLATIALSIVSFILIGLVTVLYFRNASDNYYEGRLGQKINSVIKNAEELMRTMNIRSDSIPQIKDLVLRLSDIHEMDINYYDTRGALVFSSEMDIFQKGIITRRMEGSAYQAMTKNGLTVYKTDERIGDLNYKSAYIALQNSLGRTFGYLQLPYYSKRRELRTEVSDFLGALMNVYIFLLLIASGIAIAVGNSIIRPITKIGDKLKQFKLGRRNEELTWEIKDELGDLIAEYNRMIKKLEDSTEQLVKAKQEEAWRDMAKQVAHEIKNPLTPMRLSIQYLLHSYKSNPDDVEGMLKRVSRTLLDQIDNLSQIATDFSNFARMNAVNNQKLLINELVASVQHLFSEQRDIDFTIQLPKEQLFVLADRNYLVSVFNNLIKNAIQSIPQDRRGKIGVALYAQGEYAVVKVSDNGKGILPEMWDKVFQPNFTTKTTGSGLGLAISKNFVQSINGRIYFESEPEQGTDFYVELPLVEVE